jgi:hypothetical protein
MDFRFGAAWLGSDRVYDRSMSTGLQSNGSDAHPSSLLDDWRAEVGDDEVVRIVESTRRDAAAGLIPDVTDREGLLARWSDRAHPSR